MTNEISAEEYRKLVAEVWKAETSLEKDDFVQYLHELK